MSDLVSINVNIFLRSAVKAVGFFVFMFGLSWRLTLVTLMGFPFIAVVSKVYGEYYKVGTHARTLTGVRGLLQGGHACRETGRNDEFGIKIKLHQVFSRRFFPKRLTTNHINTDCGVNHARQQHPMQSRIRSQTCTVRTVWRNRVLLQEKAVSCDTLPMQGIGLVGFCILLK